MTGQHHRRVIGYPFPVINGASYNLAAGASCNISLPTGPGELLGISVNHYGGVFADFALLSISIVVDGVVYYNGLWSDLLLINTFYDVHGLFSTNDNGSGFGSSSFAVKIPYESTFVVTFTNGGAGACVYYATLYARTGA